MTSPSSQRDRTPRLRPLGRWLAAALLLGATLCGCSRQYWRNQADDLTYDIIRNKQTDPRWYSPRVDLQADPRSRFFDPYDPDFAPLPPDDPSAHTYMHWMYDGRIRGWKHWHEFGDTAAIESPCWLEPFGMSEEIVQANFGKPATLPEIRDLSLEEAIELAYIHSRDYQTQIENVYLAALALTFERFRFDVQFIGLGGRRPSSDVTFENIPAGGPDSLDWRPRAGVSQLLPSGGQWLAEIANNTLWIFAGGGTQESTATTLSYSIIQPLLANGGKRFALEDLTLSERTMLYALRDFARYRMGFFTGVVAGGSAAGLILGQPGIGTGINALTSPTGGGGYLGLLQQTQGVANQEYNIIQLKERLDRLRVQASQPPVRSSAPLQAMPQNVLIPLPLAPKLRYDAEAKTLYLSGQLTDAEREQLLALSDDPAFRAAVLVLASPLTTKPNLQAIVQLETQLATNCNQLRQSRINLLNAIDQYKLLLGLPTDMPITLDTSLLKPFELVDPLLTRLQYRLNTFVPDPPVIYEDYPATEPMRRVGALMARLKEDGPEPEIVRGLVEEMLLLTEDIRRDGILVMENDFVRAEEHKRTHRQAVYNDNCLQLDRDPNRDLSLKNTLVTEFAGAVARLRMLQSEVAGDDVPLAVRQDAMLKLSDLREDLLKVTQNVSVVEIDLRVGMIDLNPFDMELEQSLAIALDNRQDLMNARGQVMDARRAVEVAANQLQAVLNLTAEGDISTRPLISGDNKPFDFRGKQSSIRVGVQFTSPVQLVQQRNDYRATLVGFQRARRNYMRTEDQVKFDIRTTWRNLTYIKQNFENAKEGLRSATAQLDIAVEQSSAPVAGAGGAAGGGGGANQGLNILQALTSVLNSQNQLIQLWVQYETNRLNIYNFMGIMEFDASGFWVDDFYQRRAQAARAGGGVYGPPLEEPSAPLPLSTPQEPSDESAPSVKPPDVPPSASLHAPRRIATSVASLDDFLPEGSDAEGRSGDVGRTRLGSGSLRVERKALPPEPPPSRPAQRDR